MRERGAFSGAPPHGARARSGSGRRWQRGCRFKPQLAPSGSLEPATFFTSLRTNPAPHKSRSAGLGEPRAAGASSAGSAPARGHVRAGAGGELAAEVSEGNSGFVCVSFFLWNERLNREEQEEEVDTETQRIHSGRDVPCVLGGLKFSGSSGVNFLLLIFLQLQRCSGCSGCAVSPGRACRGWAVGP